MEKIKETKTDARKRQILTKKIQKWLLNYKVMFLTLTFNDVALASTNKQTRERIVKDYLKSNSAMYLCNCDYGKKRKREHYHALIVATTLSNTEIKRDDLMKLKNQININDWLKYGTIKIEYIGESWRPKNDIDYIKTAKNLAKHFRKETTNNARIIASRGTPTKEQQINRLKALKKQKQLFMNRNQKQIDDSNSEELEQYNEIDEHIKPFENEQIEQNQTKSQEISDDDIRQFYMCLLKKRL